MAKRKAAGIPGPNLIITRKCDSNCVFCLAHSGEPAMPPGLIRKALDRGYDTVSFAGGEPLLSADLEKWVRSAVAKGTRYILVLTNGLNLTEARRLSLVDAGVDHFHFNFPSHLEKTHDRITGTRGKLKTQVEAIKRTAKAGPQMASAAFVVNSLNYRQMPDYIEYVARNFPGIFYVEFHFVRVAGRVRNDPGLVPELGKVRPYLVRALRKAEKLGLRCVADGFPLCFMKGVEIYSREAWHLFTQERYFLKKKPLRDCPPCGLSALCAGPAKEYLALHGKKGFKPAPAGAVKPLLAYFEKKKS